MQNIEGELIIENKIWFNDAERCRLRICGFTKQQIKQLINSDGLIDITLINHEEGRQTAIIDISNQNRFI